MKYRTRKSAFTDDWDVVLEDGGYGTKVRQVMTAIPYHWLAIEIAEELQLAYQTGVLTGSHEHMKADVNAFLEESAERLERREMFKESNPGF